jgi:hypothetical protein
MGCTFSSCFMSFSTPLPTIERIRVLEILLMSHKPPIPPSLLQEFWCLLHGCLYFLAIPSMSLILMIYSLANLNNVTWGTREVRQATATTTPQAQVPTGKKGIVSTWLDKAGLGGGGGGGNDEGSDYNFACGNLFRYCVRWEGGFSYARVRKIYVT